MKFPTAQIAAALGVNCAHLFVCSVITRCIIACQKFACCFGDHVLLLFKKIVVGNVAIPITKFLCNAVCPLSQT